MAFVEIKNESLFLKIMDTSLIIAYNGRPVSHLTDPYNESYVKTKILKGQFSDPSSKSTHQPIIAAVYALRWDTACTVAREIDKLTGLGEFPSLSALDTWLEGRLYATGSIQKRKQIRLELEFNKGRLYE